METIERPAPSAARPGERSTINASPFRSTRKDANGTAGIAAGKAANFSKAGAISEKAEAWAKNERCISRATLELLGVASGTTFFPDLDRKSECLFFQYPGGWKARAFPGKAFVTCKGFKLSFWNIGRVIAAAPARVYVVEGEFDALALVEAGIPADTVLSVPNGAKERPAEAPQDQKGYGYVDEALRAGLSRTKQFVWCGDGDGPGLVLRGDMVRLFGAARFHFVKWPEGCKDANDMLVTDGSEALRSLVEDGSLPWPVAGLYCMSELPESAPLTLWRPGFPEWESKIMLAPRTLSVVTGHPGHGKTALWAQIWFNVVKAHDVPICVASFETRPKPHLRRQLRTLYAGGLEMNLTDREIRGSRCLDKRSISFRCASGAKADARVVSRYGGDCCRSTRSPDHPNRPLEPP
jgi:twinkle protein